jgi:hypothetical protein
MRIQQFLVHPRIYLDSKAAATAAGAKEWLGSTTKWSACVEKDLFEAVEKKIPTIVFCQFRQEIDMVVEAARARGASAWMIRGGMSVAEVGAVVSEAKEAVTAGCSVVVVVQIVTGGVGLNLQFCQRVLFLSQHWNPAVVHQAVGRAVRIGQREVVDVFMYRIVDDVLENLDLRMSEVHAGKIGVAREVCPSFFEGFGGPAESVRTDALGRATASVATEEEEEDPT